MDLVALQFDIQWEDKPANFETVRTMLRAAAPPAGALVLLPEMFATGFSMHAEEIAEPTGGNSEQFLASLAREHGVFLLGGVGVRGQDGKARNKALVFSPDGELLAFYAKMRPFSPGGERNHYQAGDRPIVFGWGECRVAPFICYDLRFPELFREAAAKHRPELFVVVASWPAKRIEHWVRLLQARAIENQAYVVGVNRVGKDPYFAYNGRTLIVDANGDIIADGGESPGVVRASLDLPSLLKYRKGLPFLDDLRFDRMTG